MPSREPAAPRATELQRVAACVVRAGRVIPVMERAARHPLVVRAGYLLATAGGLAWGALLGTGPIERHGELIVAGGCPRWAFGRGGTTIGRVYLTDGLRTPDVLDHEAVHLHQWRRYGLAFIPLYVAAGPVASLNRFEVEAGLEKGGYLRAR